MNIKKILKIILLSILLVLFINVNNNNNIINLDIDKESFILPKTTKFSLSMWIKPKDNSYYNKVLKLYDNTSAIFILNNSEDENYKSTGITMSTDSGNTYKDNNYKLDVEIWSNITLCINGKYIDLYLDGNKVFSGLIDIALNNGRINLKIYNEFQVNDLKYYNYCLSDNEVRKDFENNIEYKFKSIQNNNIYSQNAGNYQLNNVPFKVEYISESNDLSFGSNVFSIKQNKGNNDRELHYFAKINIAGKDYQQELSIKQKGSNEVNNFETLVQNVKNKFNYYMSTSDKIQFNDDAQISCKVIKGNADYNNVEQNFTKRNNSNEREYITVECTVRKNEQEKTFTKDIILLDDYKGYLMVFFNGEDGWPMHLTGDETLYFAYSEDLNKWNLLTKKATVLTNEGTGRFRDPYINRDKDGNFVITSTQGYYNPEIYITKSKDLSSFDTTIASFNKYDSLLGLKGKVTWAPEFFYNQDKDVYTILYSEGDNGNKGIYAVDTKDFKEYSYPYLYLHTGYNSIDPDLTLIDGKYYLLYKDERENNKDIYYAVSDNLNTPLWNIKDKKGINGKFVAEGPFVLKNYKNNDYYLYLDGFKLSTIYSGKLNVGNSELNVDLSKDININKTPTRIRHFSIIPITEKEYLNIIEKCK